MSAAPFPFPVPRAVAAPPRGKVAVFAPHPDDEVIGCGGALALHRAAGDPARVLVVTDGRAGNVGLRVPERDYVAARRRECEAAAAALGGYALTFWDFPDSCAITEEAIEEVARRALAWLREDPPEVAYVPWPGEGNTDHAAVGEAARRALARAGFAGVALGYEVYTPAPVDRVLDITPVAERKRAAIACLQSQLSDTAIEHVIFGLHAQRSLFLPKGARYGEGYLTVPVPR